MTSPINSTTTESGRYYTLPSDGTKFWSVSTICRALNKPFLVGWAAKAAAECAVKEWDYLSSLKAEDRITRIKNASNRIVGRSSAKGSQIHAIIEEWIRSGCPENFDIRSTARVADLVKWNDNNPSDLITGRELQPYMDGFYAWCDKFQPVFIHSETTVWNRSEKYAGTLDIIAKLSNFGTCIMDAKSGNGIYPEVGLQLAAYARAEFYLHDGAETPLPQIDAAFALHVTSGRTKMLPVRIEDDVYHAFLFVRESFRFQEVISKDVLGPEVKK